MKYWIKDLKENQVIHAPNKEIARKLCNKFHELGLKWGLGDSYSEYLFWYLYEERTCYSPSKGHVDNLYYYKQRGYEILTIDNLLDFQTNDYPKVMEVSNKGEIWYKRVVFMEKNGYYIAWASAETIEDTEIIVSTNVWRYARDIKPKVKLTLEQVAEKFGVSVEQIEIVDNK